MTHCCHFWKSFHSAVDLTKYFSLI
jgi:hypothetical protein